MLNKLLITKATSPEEITKFIFDLREQKGKEKEVLKIINEALSFGHDFVVNLFFEEALTHQHLYMNDNSNKRALDDMEKVILKASFYVNKYKLFNWNSRLFRFMGRVADIRANYKQAIFYYKKAIKFIKLDPEPYRILEIKSFLSHSILMSGDLDTGYKMAKEIYLEFDKSEKGRNLKNKDLNTWIIWKSGHVMRIINALLIKKVNLDKDRVDEWLSQIEKELNSKPNDFSYRKQELKDLKMKLEGN